jgi:hypothetical protein
VAAPVGACRLLWPRLWVRAGCFGRACGGVPAVEGSLPAR